jgi:hypothetical protein
MYHLAFAAAAAAAAAVASKQCRSCSCHTALLLLHCFNLLLPQHRHVALLMLALQVCQLSLVLQLRAL